MNVKYKTLIFVLNKRFEEHIVAAEYHTHALQGGTVGDVHLVTGNAETADSQKLQYRFVVKVQKKFTRYGDSESWRREYDLYNTKLEATFSDALRWPTCYYSEMNTEEDEFELWLEYIDGVTGLDLAGDMYEQVALELGRYQGKLYVEQPTVLQELTNLSHADLMKNTYLHYRSWPVVYDYIRSEDCAFPKHISQMLIDVDENSDEILARIEKLPIVLCHRDFWVNNLIYSDGKFAIIDWDMSGWGYLGEDIASLIADEANLDHIVENYQRCVFAYYKGFSEYADAPSIAESCIYELILLMFGYKWIEYYLHTDDDDEKKNYIKTFEKIYELKTVIL